MPALGRHRILAGGLLTTTALLLAAVPAAASGGTHLEVGDGRVQARGAALRIPVTFTCPEGWHFSLGIQVVQAGDDHLATASGGEEEPRTCTGAKQTSTLYLQAGAHEGGGGRPFRTGPASAIASVYAYDNPDATACPIGACLGSLTGYNDQERHSSAQDKETIQLR